MENQQEVQNTERTHTIVYKLGHKQGYDHFGERSRVLPASIICAWATPNIKGELVVSEPHYFEATEDEKAEWGHVDVKVEGSHWYTDLQKLHEHVMTDRFLTERDADKVTRSREWEDAKTEYLASFKKFNPADLHAERKRELEWDLREANKALAAAQHSIKLAEDELKELEATAPAAYDVYRQNPGSYFGE